MKSISKPIFLFSPRYLNLIDRISIKYRYYPRYGVYGAQGYRYLNLIVDISIK